MHPSELVSRRHKLGLTQAELAKHLEVAKDTVARWERGERTIPMSGVLRVMLDHLDQELVRERYEAGAAGVKTASD